VDGVNVKDYKLEDLRNKMGYVPQKGMLFSGTIESNIRYGKEDATIEEIEEALEVSQAQEFVSKLDDGLNHPIAQGGTNVSGGQRQRLCIARAIVRKPEIFIFDDSFSALDYKTDKVLRAALKEYTKDSTKLIVAQRIGTIIDADKIVVLDQGKVVGIGKHQELLENCEVYKEIALSQLTKEELEYGKQEN
jgi:ATP-binding cassette subfamily B protein